MTATFKALLVAAFAVTAAAPALADEPESLVNDPRNRVMIIQPRERPLILQATPTLQPPANPYRYRPATLPEHSTEEMWFDHAKGSIW